MMPDDARGAGYKQCDHVRLMQHCGPGEGGAVAAVLARIVISAHLARVLDKGRRHTAGEEIHHQRTVSRGSKCRGSRHLTGVSASTGAQRLLAGGVELPVTLSAVRF